MVYDGTGLASEAVAGAKFKWPAISDGVMRLSSAQLRHCSTTHKDTPGADADLAAPEEIEVTDGYRRWFRLLSVVQSVEMLE